MTLQQLTYFVEVYRQKSIKVAADNLYVSHQSISVALQKLETEFDTILFIRFANKISPTKAADDLYQYALPLLNAEAILKQNMIANARNAMPRQHIKIAMSEIIVSIYGDEIAEMLTKSFIDTHFDFSLASAIEKDNFYEDYDLFIACMDSNKSLKNSSITNYKYGIHHLDTLQNYVWISNTSSLNKYDVVTYSMLKDYKYLIYNSTFNLKDGAFYPDSNECFNIKVKHSFIDYIENRKCFTNDIPIDHGKLIYADMFFNKKVSLKKTDTFSSIEIIYNKNICQNFIPVISSIII